MAVTGASLVAASTVTSLMTICDACQRLHVLVYSREAAKISAAKKSFAVEGANKLHVDGDEELTCEQIVC
jgi:hypothetical protein